jgi:hypothetical protein
MYGGIWHFQKNKKKQKNKKTNTSLFSHFQKTPKVVPGLIPGAGARTTIVVWGLILLSCLGAQPNKPGTQKKLLVPGPLKTDVTMFATELYGLWEKECRMPVRKAGHLF